MKLISACSLQLVFTLTLSVVELVAGRLHPSVKSNAVTRVSACAAGDVLHTRRHRRQAQTLTTNQMSQIVDRHNALRAMEGADNMELMVRLRAHINMCDRMHVFALSRGCMLK